jgi:hypothetical protein
MKLQQPGLLNLDLKQVFVVVYSNLLVSMAIHEHRLLLDRKILSRSYNFDANQRRALWGAQYFDGGASDLLSVRPSNELVHDFILQQIEQN